MKKLNLFLLLATILLGFYVKVEASPTPITPVQNGDKILFIGNSYTDWNGPLPTVIQQIFDASGSNIQLTTVSKGKGMGILKEYATWSSLGIIDEIRKGGWKYVVIQSWNDVIDIKDSQFSESGVTNPDYIGWPACQDTIIKYATILDAEVKAIGATTILYEPHVSHLYYDRDSVRSQDTYDKLKTEISFFHAPVIKAWNIMKTRYPNTDPDVGCTEFSLGSYVPRLYADCGHQSTNGMMLDALTFYTILTGGKSALTLEPIQKSVMINPEYYDEFAQIGFNVGKTILQLNNSFTADAQNPTQPSDLTVSLKKSDSFKLTWTASTDDIGVLAYRIYRDDVLIDTTAAQSYTVKNLQSATAYNIKIVAFDSEGKFSTKAKIDVTTMAAANVDFTGILSQWDFTNNHTTTPVISANISDGISEAVVSHGSGLTMEEYGGNTYSTRSIANPSPATLTDAMLTNNYISVVIKPINGCDLSITQLKAELLGSSLNYALFSSVKGFNSANIISTQSGGGLKTIDITEHTSISEQIEFRLYVYGDYPFGYAGFGQWGTNTTIDLVITGSVKSNISYTFPTNLTATNLTESGFTLNWAAAKDAVSYKVYKNGTLFGTTTDLSLPINGVAINGQYSMTVSAIDNGSVESELSDALLVTIPDLHNPSIPQNLTATGISTNTFTLNWDSSTDNVGVYRYEIFMNGVSWGNTDVNSLPIPYLTEGSIYNMTVEAIDAAGNRSGKSSSLQVTTLGNDTQAPSAPTTLTSSSLTTTSFTLNWTASTDNVAVASYEIFKNGVSIGTSTSLSFEVTGLTTNTPYTMTVKAKDAANNVSAASTAIEVTLAETVSNPLASWDMSSLGKGVRSMDATGADGDITVSALAISTVFPVNNELWSGDHGLIVDNGEIIAFNLAESITKELYFEVTITPVAGKSMSIKSIDIAATNYFNEGKVSLLSSKNGFTADKEISSITETSGYENVAVMNLPITGHDNLTEAVTFRMYYHNPSMGKWEQLGIGRRNTTTDNYDFAINGTVQNAVATSINANESSSPLMKIYPNPSSEFVSIDFGTIAGNASITILDAQGRSVMQMNASNKKSIEINIAHLNNGVYLVKYSTDDKTTSLRFVKQ